MRKKSYRDDERVISAFLKYYRDVDIIRETNLSRSTVYRLQRDKDFQKTINERKQMILKAAVNKMTSYLTKDVEILQQIIEDPETSAQTKINGIQLLMSQLREWTTTVNIIKELEELKEATGNDLTRLTG